MRNCQISKTASCQTRQNIPLLFLPLPEEETSPSNPFPLHILPDLQSQLFLLSFALSPQTSNDKLINRAPFLHPLESVAFFRFCTETTFSAPLSDQCWSGERERCPSLERSRTREPGRSLGTDLDTKSVIRRVNSIQPPSSPASLEGGRLKGGRKSTSKNLGPSPHLPLEEGLEWYVLKCGGVASVRSIQNS
ncbi:hypothetical protein AVEN_69743-1 [Araneus ventricosus]|uniref:Uncharacterized protein n=1 Tax=Araneus ventricosus TaxID=182803 RepID=A0A4Y2CXR3_ARAVE|nr:hypothetical protein AVEN_69743-1 [Araneus ventricosus]